METTEKCFACGKPLPKSRKLINVAREDQTAYVGPDCYKKVVAAGEAGYQPTGYGARGPRLYCMSTGS